MASQDSHVRVQVTAPGVQPHTADIDPASGLASIAEELVVKLRLPRTEHGQPIRYRLALDDGIGQSYSAGQLAGRLPLRLEREEATAPRSGHNAESQPIIFIGHGHSPAWRDLKDHLQDHHDLRIVCWESKPQAGRTNTAVVNDMLRQANFALLVHTAEDETADGQIRARQNVIHETGLFQGGLGLGRAIIVREEGCEPFSNLSGVVEVRFSSGNVREAFGEILGVLRREFPRV
jgi:Predicted nucleotide-binding protein containing TIR-like domain